MRTRTILYKKDGTREVVEGWRGLGDVIASATKALGIKPCGGCKKRQNALNKAVPFKPVDINPN